MAARQQPRGKSDQPLIRPGDPAPYSWYNADGRAPIFVVCDHASREFPAAMNRLGLAPWVMDQHVVCDFGAARMTRSLAERFDAPALLAGYSRVVVDLNRCLDDPTCFIQVSDGIAIPGNLEISNDDRELRTRSFYRPYHDAIASRLAEFEANGIVPVLVAVHSCTPVFDKFVRPWHIGVLWDKDPRIAIPLLERLNRIDNICVGANEPYSGRHPHDFTVDFHAESAGLPNINLEFRQDLIESREGTRVWAERVGDIMQEILADESLYTRLQDSDN